MNDRDRWVTAWTVLPGDPPLAHRPDPDDPAQLMCRIAVPAEHSLLTSRPADVNECGRCALAVGRARKKARKAADRLRRGNLRQPRPVTDPEQADRLDRARQRSTSVRTVTGGLPTLGQRR